MISLLFLQCSKSGISSMEIPIHRYNSHNFSAIDSTQEWSKTEKAHFSCRWLDLHSQYSESRCESSINKSILAPFSSYKRMIPSFNNHLYALFLLIKKGNREPQNPKQKCKIEHTPRLSSHPFSANPCSSLHCKKNPV